MIKVRHQIHEAEQLLMLLMEERWKNLHVTFRRNSDSAFSFRMKSGFKTENLSLP